MKYIKTYEENESHKIGDYIGILKFHSQGHGLPIGIRIAKIIDYVIKPSYGHASTETLRYLIKFSNGEELIIRDYEVYENATPEQIEQQRQLQSLWQQQEQVKLRCL